MTAYALITWIATLVLSLGAIAIFAVFLTSVLRRKNP